MYYDDYDEPTYYEPSLADEILMEYQQKMKDALLESVKFEIEQIKNENIRLEKENEKYKQRERDLKYKEENLKREVINEFYKSNIEDTLKQYIEESEVWFADVERYQNDKCNLCNKDRQLIAKFPNGKTTKKDCDCAKVLSRYVPALSEITLIQFGKRNSRYSSDRKFYLSKTYKPGNNRSEYDYDYQEFKIYHVVNEFNEGITELHESKRYGEKIGFINKEDCQKYCNWLNREDK